MRVARLGLGLGVLGLLGMGLLVAVPSSVLVYAAVLAFAIGEDIFTAIMNTLLSQAAGEAAQGKVQGGSQSLSSAAQVVGPLVGGQLSSRLGASVPFYVGSALVLLAGFALQGGLGRSSKTKTVEV